MRTFEHYEDSGPAVTRKIWSLNYNFAKPINFYICKTLTELESAHTCNVGNNFMQQMRPNEIKKVERSSSVKLT